jgi:protein SCO1/2
MIFIAKKTIIRTMQTPESKKPPRLMLFAISAVMLVLGLATVLWWYKATPRQLTEADLPVELAMNYLPEGKPISGLQMTDQNGQAFTEARFQQHWSFVFFGFTNCPDVCPTTMLVMKQVWQKLPPAAHTDPKPQLIFVSVDPDRDSVAKLKDYVAFYHPEFIAVRGEHDKLDVLVKQLGALYGYEDGPDKDNYTVNHSAQLVVVDPQGNLRAIFSPPFVVDELVKTFVHIRQFHKG